MIIKTEKILKLIIKKEDNYIYQIYYDLVNNDNITQKEFNEMIKDESINKDFKHYLSFLNNNYFVINVNDDYFTELSLKYNI